MKRDTPGQKVNVCWAMLLFIFIICKINIKYYYYSGIDPDVSVRQPSYIVSPQFAKTDLYYLESITNGSQPFSQHIPLWPLTDGILVSPIQTLDTCKATNSEFLLNMTVHACTL